MESIKNQIFRQGIVFSSITIACLGIISAIALYEGEKSKAYDIIQLRNESTSHIIEGHFTDIHDIVDALGELSFVRNGAQPEGNAKRQVLDYFKAIQAANNKVTHIYAGYDNGDLLINHYDIPQDFHVMSRPWFTHSVATAPDVVSGLPYQAAITNDWLISTATAFKAEDGTLGVVGIDSSLEIIANLLAKPAARYATSMSYITNLNGVIIMHPVPERIGDRVYFHASGDLAENSHRGFQYQQGQDEKIAFYSRVPGKDWLLFTTVDSDEVFKPIWKELLLTVFLISAVSFLVLLAFSRALSRSVSRPLVALKQHVRAVISGKDTHDVGYDFPKNEIGHIANEVLQLAKHELCVRANSLDNINVELESKNRELERLASLDQLTGLYNRRKMDASLYSELQMFEFNSTPFSVVLIDIDHFKSVNDTYGHAMGDKVLQEAATQLKNSSHCHHIVGRWGGEEFLVVLPSLDLKQAMHISEKLRKSFAEHQFTNELKLTISVGVTQVQDKDDIEQIMQRADKYLYQAKHNGRNKVVAF
ncbi:sensor domain-containing diguanylate cyclase [Vibrio sp. SCSIO 43136]|uniref:sensor domain-containing diguanylate cyclase n=1 Tax=Vibrio sp. SCSIO 43136 TaxID=2819101 RepID=UPI002075359B|nr:sensor domain-containing diguanylate cyclase [Vibrio sp. SCSIO 43136]USD67291.1 GGDEF domain-containing protein [Vibrio sp. SCSIO 43136]